MKDRTRRRRRHIRTWKAGKRNLFPGSGEGITGAGTWLRGALATTVDLGRAGEEARGGGGAVSGGGGGQQGLEMALDLGTGRGLLVALEDLVDILARGEGRWWRLEVVAGVVS